jgi:HK97 family phage major capsid protein
MSSRPDLRDIVTKGDMTTANFALGGELNDQQFDDFFELVKDQPTLVQDITIQPMDSHTAKLESFGFGGRITHKAIEGTAPTSDKRAEMTGSKVELKAEEIQVEARVSLTMAENSLKKDPDAFYDYVVARMAEQFALDVEYLIINGDKDSSDDYLSTIDGLLVQSVSHVVPYAVPTTIDDDVLYAGILAYPAKYRADKANIRYYCNSDAEEAYKKFISTNLNSVGAVRMVEGTDITYYSGKRFYVVSSMPTDTVLLTNRKNIVLGVFRDVTPYRYPDYSARQMVFGLTMRLDTKYGEEDGVVKITGLNPSGTTTSA